EFKQKLPLKLSLAELTALLMSRQLLAPAGASLLGPAVTSAFDKITGVLSRDALQVIDRMRDTVGVRAFGAKLQLPVTENLPASFDPGKYLAGALGIISGDLVTVKVVFARKLARYIRERLWHPSQKFRDLTDGRIELTLHVADTLEVRRWILGYGEQAEVIEPAGMREALRQQAEALAERLAPKRKPLATATASERDGRGRSVGDE